MIVASDADDAWCPPTFSPSSFGRRWLALWIIHVASHSTLRSNCASISMVSFTGFIHGGLRWLQVSGGRMAGAAKVRRV